MTKRLVILFDGHCVLCTAAVDRLKSLHSTAVIEALPLQDEKASPLLPEGYSEEQLYREIHVIDTNNGRIFRGSDAIIYVMTMMPSLRWLAFMYRIPGMKPLASLLYRLAARHRYRLFGRTDRCASGQCQLPHKVSKK